MNGRKELVWLCVGQFARLTTQSECSNSWARTDSVVPGCSSTSASSNFFAFSFLLAVA